jgi:hypothetical protein
MAEHVNGIRDIDEKVTIGISANAIVGGKAVLEVEGAEQLGRGLLATVRDADIWRTNALRKSIIAGFIPDKLAAEVQEPVDDK